MTCVTLITDEIRMPHFKRERVPEQMPTYKLNVLNGAEHPLQGEDFIYKLTPIIQLYQDASGVSIQGYPASREGMLSLDEVEFIKNACVKMPEVDWAIDNSFDGLYIKKYIQSSSYRMVYELYVYMEEKQATYWRLKFK